MKLIKKIVYFCFFMVLFIFLTEVNTSCNLYRSGAVVRQGGVPRQAKYHSKTATAKSRRKRKY